MVSIGVMFVTQAIVRIIIGPSDRRFFDGEKFIIKAGEFKEMTGLSEGLAIKSTQVITIFVTIVLVSFLFWFFPYISFLRMPLSSSEEDVDKVHPSYF